MFKFRSLLISLLCGFFTFTALNAQQTLFLPENISLEEAQQARKEVAWNVFQVLGIREHSNGVQYALACAKHPAITASLAARLAYARITGKENSITKALAGMKNMPHCASAQAFLQWFKKCGEYGLATIGEDVAVSLMPVEGIFEVIKDIHADNGLIIQTIASNIAPNILEQVMDRFETKYDNELFDYLMIGKVVNYSSFGPDKTPNLDPRELTTYIKPNPMYFADYNQTWNPNNAKLIVYISDNLEMIEAATKAGWACIHFDASKARKQSEVPAIEQLRTDLKTLGLLN